MKGAKVLDPEPYRPGRDEVAKQMAQGDARPATEAEVAAASAGIGKKSSVHDQEF